MTAAKTETFWIALCWGRVFAGPEAGGPPWLFVHQEHAAQYAAQLRGNGVAVEVKQFEPKCLEWRGKSLLQVPQLPPPVLSAGQPAVEHATADDVHAGNGASVPPPPDVE